MPGNQVNLRVGRWGSCFLDQGSRASKQTPDKGTWAQLQIRNGLYGASPHFRDSQWVRFACMLAMFCTHFLFFFFFFEV